MIPSRKEASGTARERPISVLHCVLSVATGGLEMFLLQLSKATDREQFSPSVVCLQEKGELAPRFEAAGIPVEIIDRPLSGGPATLASLVRFLRQKRPDILHTHNRGPMQHGAFARLAVHVPVHVHTRHDRTHASTWKATLLERAATRLTDTIVPVSQDAYQVARDFDKARLSQLRLIHNGIDVAAFPVQERDGNGWRAVHVARLQPVKDQATLLRAAAIVAGREPRFRLDIVGDGDSRAELEALAQELQLGNVVTFHGMQSDVRSYLERANLFVLSSTSEGLAMTLLEAMAAGLPIVATNVGGNREAVADGVTGSLVPAGNPTALADAIYSILSSPDIEKRYGQAGRTRAIEHFSLSTMMGEYQSLYLEQMQLSQSSGRSAA